MTSEENLCGMYLVRRKFLCERICRLERFGYKNMKRPKFIDYLSVLIKEASACSKTKTKQDVPPTSKNPKLKPIKRAQFPCVQ